MQSGLNPEQLQGATHENGPLLILAGAGSGKTRVITTRIAWLIAERGVSPKRILALTFTNKAAGEMRERVHRLLPDRRARGLWVGTFHAFGVFLLREHCELLGYRKKFSIFNSSDRLHLLQNIMKDLHIDLEALPVEEAAWRISDAKNALIHPAEGAGYFDDPAIVDIYHYYQKTLQGFNILDFDDLLLLCVDLLEGHPELARQYGVRFRYLMVDEYQDTNQAQYRMLRCLTREHDNITVVGDDDQSIYAWRGADISNILNFEKDFPGTKVIRLEQNYRSSGTILDAANGVISRNQSRKGKKLWTAGGRGEPVKVIAARDEVDEAEAVLDELQELRRLGQRFADCAVVFRTNFQTRPFEELFAARGIPYVVIGGTRFFDRKEVKDLMAYLRLLANRQDEIALLRTINRPRRGVGPQTIEKIVAYALANDLTLYQALQEIDRVKGIDAPVAHQIAMFCELIEEFSHKIFTARSMVPVVKELIQASGYEEELMRDAAGDAARYQKSQRFLQEAVNSIASFENDEDLEKHDLYTYLERVALLAADDEDEEHARDAVTLLTMHACKGLEFPVVFICGVEEGNIPHARSIEERPENLEEERRLFYVGMTRAMRLLYLSFTEGRRRYGEIVACQPSRFLGEIDADLLAFVEPVGDQAVPDEEFAALVGKFS